jgi:hypothetical protein
MTRDKISGRFRSTTRCRQIIRQLLPVALISLASCVDSTARPLAQITLDTTKEPVSRYEVIYGRLSKDMVSPDGTMWLRRGAPVKVRVEIDERTRRAHARVVGIGGVKTNAREREQYQETTWPVTVTKRKPGHGDADGAATGAAVGLLVGRGLGGMVAGAFIGEAMSSSVNELTVNVPAGAELAVRMDMRGIKPLHPAEMHIASAKSERRYY